MWHSQIWISYTIMATILAKGLYWGGLTTAVRHLVSRNLDVTLSYCKQIEIVSVCKLTETYISILSEQNPFVGHGIYPFNIENLSWRIFNNCSE